MTITPAWHLAMGGYLTYLQAGGSPSTTIATRREHMMLFARSLGGDPWTTTPDALLALFASMDCAQETRRGRRTSIRSFYKWGVDQGHVTTNLALCLPVVKASRPNPRPVPDDAYRLALAKADARSRLMVRLSAEIGLRRTEVATVHSRNLIEDLVGWSLIIEGKGRKVRVLPLPASLAADLLALPEGWAFPGKIDGHLSPRYVGTVVSRLLPQAYTMHKLRHRFATRAYAVDRDVFTLQDLLGHSSPSTTRHYVAIPNDALRRTVEAAAA